jgi:ribbon-helix-helix CopG family protein
MLTSRSVKRTTVYLEPELEVLLKLETQRQQRPMAEIIREALRTYVSREPRQAPPGAGAFTSGRTDTAARADDVLRETGFAQQTRARSKRRRS